MPLSVQQFLSMVKEIPALEKMLVKHLDAKDAGKAVTLGRSQVEYNKALADAAPRMGYDSLDAMKADLHAVAPKAFPDLAGDPMWSRMFGAKGHGKPSIPGMNAAESKRGQAAIAAEEAFTGKGGAIEKPSFDRQVMGEAEGTAKSQDAVRSARDAADEALRPQYTRKNKKGEDVTRRHNVKKEFDLAAASELRREGLASEEAAAQINGMPLGKRPSVAEKANTKVPHEVLGSDDIGTFAKEREVQQAIVGEPSEAAIDMVRGHPAIPSSRYANDERIIEALLGRKPVTVAADKAAGAEFEGVGRNIPGIHGEVVTNAGLTPRDPSAGAVTRSERVKPTGQDQLFDPEQYRLLGGDPRRVPPVPEQQRIDVDDLLQQLRGEAPGQQSIGLAIPEAEEQLGRGLALMEEAAATRLPYHPRGFAVGPDAVRPRQGRGPGEVYGPGVSELDRLLQELTAAQ